MAVQCGATERIGLSERGAKTLVVELRALDRCLATKKNIFLLQGEALCVQECKGLFQRLSFLLINLARYAMCFTHNLFKKEKDHKFTDEAPDLWH